MVDTGKHPGSPCYCRECASEVGSGPALPHPCWICKERRGDHCYSEGKQTCRECRAAYCDTPRGKEMMKLQQEIYAEVDAEKAAAEAKAAAETAEKAHWRRRIS